MYFRLPKTRRAVRLNKVAAGKKRSLPLRVERLEARETPATWTPLASLIPNSAGGQGMMLLSDGTVMVQGGADSAAKTWYRLTPNSSGSYINGTWTQLTSMGLERLFFASNLLPDGRLFVLGGEYSGPNTTSNFTNTGEIYNPVTNSWSGITNFPQTRFGDDPTVVLANGKVLAGYISGAQTYLYTPSTNTWAATGTKLRNDRSDEETWALLPDGSVLSYDIFASISAGVGHAQHYVPSTGAWVDAGNLPALLSTSALGDELGPTLQLPDGRVWQVGATNNTAIYTPSATGSGTWVAGPSFPANFGADDAPGAMLPNGHALVAVDTTSPLFTGPTKLYDFDPVANALTLQTTPTALTTALNHAAFLNRMLVLPNGDVLMTTSARQLWEYTPDGSPQNSWRPTVSNIVYNGNLTYTITGTQLTGLSEGASYGDDAEMSSNYPIVQLTSSGGTVFYARTFNWTPSVATGATPVTTQFALPAGLPAGTYTLQVIANGIASTGTSFTTPIYVDTAWVGLSDGTPITDIDPVTSGNQAGSVGVNAFATVNTAIAATPAFGVVVVNGSNGSSGGDFGESVNVNKQVTVFLQRGPASFGSLTGIGTSTINTNGLALTVGGDNTSTQFDGVISGSGGVSKAGTGAFTLTGANTWAGSTAVAGGNLIVTGSLASASAVSVFAGATLSGTGNIGGITVSGTLAPGNSVGILNTGSVAFSSGASFAIPVNSAVPGTGFSQLVAGGSVNLTGAALNLSLDSGFFPTVGTLFDILVNTSGSPITGTFAGLPQGASLFVNGQLFSISYAGGTGNDVVVTRTAGPTVLGTQVNDGAAQRSLVTSLQVTFSTQVTFAGAVADAFTITRSGGGSVAFAASASVVGGVTVVTLDSFTGAETEFGSLVDGRYTLTALSSQISANGQQMASDYIFNDTQGLFRMFGDVNGDQTINGLDFGFFKNAFGTQAGDPNYLSYLDLNGDGVINGFDFGQFRNRFGTMLP